MSLKSIFILSLFVFLLAGCVPASPLLTQTGNPLETPTLDFSQPTVTIYSSPSPIQPTTTIATSALDTSTQQAIMDDAFTVVNALMHQDMASISRFVNPQKGLRFSPYAYVKDTDQLFPADKLSGLSEDSKVLWWGNYDGSGEPINLTFADFYAKFVYDADFANAPQISLNHRLGTGNSIDNIQDVYPGAMVVEFHFPGFDTQYDGMDWRSLRLVFTQDNQVWYLRGIIHDQWTI